jgi:hypothetical protein
MRRELAGRKVVRPNVSCAGCDGHGYVPIADQVFDTLLMLLRMGPSTAGQLRGPLAKMLGDEVGPTAINNRLEYLRREGLVERVRRGREWVYEAVRPAVLEQRQERETG